jgi:hypothetical protein
VKQESVQPNSTDYLSARSLKTLAAKRNKTRTDRTPADRRFAKLMIHDAWTEWRCDCLTCFDIPRTERTSPS